MGPRTFAGQTDRREESTPLQDARDLEVHDAVQTDHHPQGREDLRVVRRRHPRDTEEPLGIDDRIGAPGDVVDGCRHEDAAVERTLGMGRSTLGTP